MAIVPDDNLERETSLIIEALIREMGRAGRWSAVKDIWDAMLHVRRMSESMIRERNYLHNPSGIGTMRQE